MFDPFLPKNEFCELEFVSSHLSEIGGNFEMEVENDGRVGIADLTVQNSHNSVRVAFYCYWVSAVLLHYSNALCEAQFRAHTGLLDCVCGVTWFPNDI